MMFPFLIGKVLTKLLNQAGFRNGSLFPFLIGKVLTYSKTVFR